MADLDHQRIAVYVDEEIKSYAVFRSYLAQEDSLLNFRMTWLLTINGFLFAAFGLIGQKVFFITTKCDPSTMISLEAILFWIFSVGLTVSVFVKAAISGAKEAARTIQKQFRKSFHVIKDNENLEYIILANGRRLPGIAAGGGKKGFNLGSEASRFIPWVFICAWILAVLGLAISHVYFHGIGMCVAAATDASTKTNAAIEKNETQQKEPQRVDER